MLLQDKLLTVVEVANALGVSVRSVKRWIADGSLRAMHVGSVVRVDPDEVMAFVVPWSPGGDQDEPRSGANVVDKRMTGPRETV